MTPIAYVEQSSERKSTGMVSLYKLVIFLLQTFEGSFEWLL